MKKYSKIYVLSILFILVFGARLEAQSSVYSLNDCLTYAWENNTDVGRGNNEIKSQSSHLEQSKAALLPDLSVNAGQNTSYTNSFQKNDTGDEWKRDTNSSLNLSLSSSMSLYNGAKLKNTIIQNMTNLSVAESDLQTQKELISLNVLVAYIDVLLTKEQLENSEIQLKSTEKQLEYAQIRKSTGIISMSDYLNIKSQYSVDKAAYVASQNELRINLVSLMQIMNMPVNDVFNIKDPDIEALLKNAVETDAGNIYNIALGIRPEIKTAEYELESARMGIELAKADARPSLSLTGSIGSGYSNNLSGIDLDEQLTRKISPSIGLSLSIPIFQRKQVKNQIAQATIQAENFQYNLKDIKNNLRKAIEQACIDTQTAVATYEASQEQYQAELESYNLAEEMFGQGLINSVDYLILKNNLTTSENNLTRAKYNVVLHNKIIEYYLGQPVTL